MLLVDILTRPTIIVLAELTEVNCQNTAIAKIPVVPLCGLPYTITEYPKLNWSDEKAYLQAVAIDMEGFKDMELFGFFYFDKKKGDDTEEVFAKMDVLYRLLKAGINFPNGYYKTYVQYHEELKSGKRKRVTVNDIGGTECQKCHY